MLGPIMSSSLTFASSDLTRMEDTQQKFQYECAERDKVNRHLRQSRQEVATLRDLLVQERLALEQGEGYLQQRLVNLNEER
jgi:hypothetical protein